jgi:hypothetical protein
VFTAVTISIWLWNTYSNLSSTPVVGNRGCIAGVVNSVTAADLNPFSFAHGRIDVVLKPFYWPVVTLNSPGFIWCSHCTNCAPSLWPGGTNVSNFNTFGCSPMLRCYYHSQRVVNGSLGASIGGTIGAAIGAVFGTALGIAAMVAIGCTATGPFAPICWLVLLLAIVIAVAVVVAAALLGGGIGTAVGEATASDSSPSGDPLGSATAVAVGFGAYVMVVGNIVKVPDARYANAIYLAGWIPDPQAGTITDQTLTNGNGTTIFGKSMGTPDFCFTDPVANIVGDPCNFPM